MGKYEGKPAGVHVGSPSPRPGSDMDPRDALQNIPGFGMRQTQANYQTAIAVQHPRDLEAVEKSILHEAALMGEDFVYAWDVDTKDGKTQRIEGLSIDGAMVLYRNWMNCALPTTLQNETATHFVIEAVFIDLETGTSVPRLFRQRKGQKLGKMDPERGEDISFQIGQSKCQRNAIDKALPRWLIDKAIGVAKDAAVKKYEDVPKWTTYMKKRAATLGITDDELQAKAGAKFADWIPADVAYLASIFTAIAKKETSITAEFRAPKDAPPAEPSEPKASAPTDEPHLPDIPEEKPAAAPPAESKTDTPAGAPVPPPAPAPASPPPPPKTEPKPSADDFQPPVKK